MKLYIYTAYELTDENGITTSMKASTLQEGGLGGIMDVHNEKVGAIERKILKNEANAPFPDDLAADDKAFKHDGTLPKGVKDNQPY